MTTLSLFSRGNVQIPGATTWYLADLGEFRGKQELYTHQAPQRLKTLLEHALIESAVSSNRLEGVEVDPGRVRKLLASPKPLFRDRDEEEVRGYRDALRMIHEQGADLALTEETILLLHRLTRGQIWDAGCYKSKAVSCKSCFSSFNLPPADVDIEQPCWVVGMVYFFVLCFGDRKVSSRIPVPASFERWHSRWEKHGYV